MKRIRIMIGAPALLAISAHPAFAASTATVYNSGILVLGFLGICALVVVAQLIPAIMVLLGMLKGMVKGMLGAKETVSEPSKENA